MARCCFSLNLHSRWWLLRIFLFLFIDTKLGLTLTKSRYRYYVLQRNLCSKTNVSNTPTGNTIFWEYLTWTSPYKVKLVLFFGVFWVHFRTHEQDSVDNVTPNFHSHKLSTFRLLESHSNKCHYYCAWHSQNLIESARDN